MINRNAAAISSVSSFDSETHEFTLDSNSLAHLMEVLTKLYSRPEESICREYLTNAIDANIAAGNDDPVVLVPPNQFSQELKISDSGIGMSKSDLINVYSKYGASTKRNTDTQAGMLGLGSKSALAYTHQFVVSSIKDGLKNVVMIHRTNTGGINMTFITDSEATNEPNGTTVTIPIKIADSDRVRSYCDWYVSLIDRVSYGKKKPNSDLFFVNDRVALLPKEMNKSYSNPSYLVMGNVPYLSSNYTAGTGYSYVYYASMGEFDFEPSRENVVENDKVRSIRASILKTLEHDVLSSVEKHLNSIVDMNDRIDEYIRLVKNYGFRSSKSLIAGIKTNFSASIIHLDSSYTIRESHYKTSWLRSKNNIAIENFELKRFVKDHRSKLEKYLDREDISIVILNPDNDVKSLLDDENIIDWNDVNQIKLDKPKVQRKTQEYTPGVLRRGSSHSPIYYCFLSEESQYLYLCNAYRGEDAQIFTIRKNKLKAFLKDYPEAQHVNKFASIARKNMESFNESLTDEEINFYATMSNSIIVALGNQIDYIEDKELVALVKKSLEIRRTIGAFSTWSHGRKIVVSEVLLKYPLLNDLSSYAISESTEKEIVFYVNAKYKENI